MHPPIARPAEIPFGLLHACRSLRWWPFLFSWIVSTGLSLLAPNGRKPFEIDWSLSLDAVEFSAFKEPHIGAAAIVGLLAILAASRSRPWLAVALTVGVGACWELAQTTVIGHNARLSDLLPDALGALLGCAWGYAVLWLLEGATRAELSA